MTKQFLLSTAAAALIAGTGFAYAQGTGMGREGAGGGSTMQQNAPSTEQGRGSATTPMRNDASDYNGMSHEGTTRGSESKQHAQDTKHGKMQNEKSAEDYGKSGASSDHSKGMRSESHESGKSEKNMRAEERNGKSDSSKSAVDTNRSSTMTTGQAGGGAKLSTEQRTKITTVIRDQHVRPTTNVNFSIAVGTRVPRTVSFHPLPAEIVSIYPSWRGYEFFLVRDEIIVVDPRTLEIVAVLNA
ncbi:DUF1236 domain-containing protein [Nitrobacter sp. NHB1]|uniref:DUF1236 domain-containing protein n=1 Tax=Nitrobacter sp. NHB1 TaxID=3119830 RepID=UPI003000539F